MQNCPDEAVSIVQGVDANKSVVKRRTVYFTLRVCRLHKRAWEIGWEHADRGVAISHGQALDLARKEADQ